ncbi:MAG: MmgE/PrpD family protein [Deltaproteobacteria bacterium]|jgi:2-methylcitrate dehydratase PrpD|nr:MmgE/PrpD family protein [Deltaproteobacteria bacterium]
MDATARIARFVVETEFQKIPSEAVKIAKTAVLDCLGVALAGSKESSARICAEIARQEHAKEESSVIGQGFKSSAMHAAFANGTAAHALDFDHSFTLMGQPTAPIIPAIISLGESLGSSGRRCLEAYVAGFETITKLVMSLRQRSEDGWHPPSTFGSFGAAVACAKLQGLNQTQVETTLGTAASMASGLVCNFGTMSKPLHVGLGARNGVMAAKLGQSGFTANKQAIEAGLGFYEVFYPGAEPDKRPLEQLGTVYELINSGIRIKPYPCGGLTHPAIDGVLEFKTKNGITAEMVESIDVGVARHTFERIVFRVPENGLQGKFSMPYLLARAIIDGRLFLDAFTDSAVRDENVLRFAEKVQMRLDPDLQPTALGSRPCKVTIRLRDGRSFSRQIDYAKGSREAPMTNEELKQKFVGCARQALDDSAIERIIEYVEHLETLEDIRPLCRLLIGANRP